jgi:histidyl-tRNA synthetase
MLKIKPQNPKGVRDYLPLENQRREYIISVIKKHYEFYSFLSLNLYDIGTISTQ